jgi:hypothetical protein
MVKADLKRDKMGHVKNEEMGTEAKSTKLPGQMYVPKKTHDSANFVGEQK